MSSTNNDGRLLSFRVGDDERLVIGAVERTGDRRTIYEGVEPDEYALVPTDELAGDVSPADISAGELRVEDLRILGPSTYVGPDDETDLALHVDGDEVVSQGAPGVYGLLWIPLADL